MDPVADALLAAACDATAASAGWLLRLFDDRFEVVAFHESGALVPERSGTRLPIGPGAASFVAGAGQPAALRPRPGDPLRHQGPAAFADAETESVLAVACEHRGEIVGVIELGNKAGGLTFDFDDVELLQLLSGIAGAALSASATRSEPPAPPAIAASLEVVARRDPDLYASIASLLDHLAHRP